MTRERGTNDPIIQSTLLTTALWLMITGCAPSPGLRFELSADHTIAGQAIGYSVTFLGDVDDHDLESVKAIVTSDVELELRQAATSVTPTVASHHVLTARVEYRGVEYTAQAEIDVTPDILDSVDLILNDPTIVAGRSGAFQVHAADRYGNSVTPPDSPRVSAATRAVRIDGFQFTSTRAGDHALTLTVGAASDSEILTVSPARAASISLSLGNMDIDRNQTVAAFAELRDPYGNKAGDPWSLSVDGTAPVTINGAELTFREEGIYTITATVDGTSLSDTVGPVVLDSSAPRIHLDSPGRAAWSTGSESSVTGKVTDDWSALAEVLVQGDPVTVSDDGTFRTAVPCEPGVNLVSTRAEDRDGNRSTDARALLCGEFGAYGRRGVGDGVSRGIDIRLHQGSGGLKLFEDRAAAMLDADILDDYIPDPVASDYESWCVFGACVVYSVRLRVLHPTMSHATISLDPQSNGTIRARLRLFNPSFDWYGSASIASVRHSGRGDIDAYLLDVSASLRPSIRNHAISFSVSNVSVSTYGFVFEMPWWLEDVLEFFGLHDWIQASIRYRMELAITNAVRTSLPTVLAQEFQEFAINESFEVPGSRIRIEAMPSHVSIDAHGVTLGLKTHVTTDDWTLPEEYEHLGSLRQDYTPRSWYRGRGANIAFSADFLNQALLAVWGGGSMNLELTAEELGISSDVLERLLPGLSELTVTLDPRLPPVVVPGSESGVVTLQLGDYLLSFYDGDARHDNLVLQAYATVFIDMDFRVGDGVTLVPVLESAEPHFDIVVSAGDRESQESFMRTFFPRLLPALSEQLEGIPLPAIDGVTFRTSRIYPTGSRGGYVALDGVLVD